MDILDHIYNLLKDDPFMQTHIEGRFMFSEFPDAKDVKKSYVTLNSIAPGIPVGHADGKRVMDSSTARVDVFIRSRDGMNENPRTLCSELMERIAKILDENDFGQTASFTPTYDKDFALYRESRSFEINYYRSDY